MPATTMNRSTRTNVQLANLDLNLLVSLDVLLQERSVTRAAARLGLSQPTLSTTLARLRRHFGDELLTRVGNRYELTPLAADLLPRTADAVSVVQKIFARQPEFEPAESDREFAVLASDYVITVFGQALAVALRERAPGIGLRLELIKGGFLGTAAETLRAVRRGRHWAEPCQWVSTVGMAASSSRVRRSPTSSLSADTTHTHRSVNRSTWGRRER